MNCVIPFPFLMRCRCGIELKGGTLCTSHRMSFFLLFCTPQKFSFQIPSQIEYFGERRTASLKCSNDDCPVSARNFPASTMLVPPGCPIPCVITNVFVLFYFFFWLSFIHFLPQKKRHYCVFLIYYFFWNCRFGINFLISL